MSITLKGKVTTTGNSVTIADFNKEEADEALGAGARLSVTFTPTNEDVTAEFTPGREVTVTLEPGDTPEEREEAKGGSKRKKKGEDA